MLRNISLGIYYPGNSLLHRLQARTKLLLLFWFIVIFLLADRHIWHFAPYIVLVLLTILGIAVAGVSFRLMFQRMWLLLLLAAIGAIPAVLIPLENSRPLRTFGPYLIFYSTLRTAIFVYFVLPGIYIILLLLPIPALRNFWQSRWLKRMKILLIFITICALGLLWLIRNISGANTFAVGPIILTYENIWVLMDFYTLFLVLYALSLLLTMTTTPIALIEGLTVLLSPLRRLRLPVDDFALMTLIALRFIPTLTEELEQLIKAQAARGSEISQGTLRQRLQSLGALFVPLMQGTLRRAADLATALEARGYEVEGRQTLLHEKPLGRIDYLVMGIVVFVTLGALAL